MYKRVSPSTPTPPRDSSRANFQTQGVVIGTVVGSGNLHGVVSSNIFLSSEAPRYWTGHAVCLAFIAVLSLGGSTTMHFLLKRENQKRRSGQRDDMLAGKTDYEIKIDHVVTVRPKDLKIRASLRKGLTVSSLERRLFSYGGVPEPVHKRDIVHHLPDLVHDFEQRWNAAHVELSALGSSPFSTLAGACDRSESFKHLRKMGSKIVPLVVYKLNADQTTAENLWAVILCL